MAQLLNNDLTIDANKETLIYIITHYNLTETGKKKLLNSIKLLKKGGKIVVNKKYSIIIIIIYTILLSLFFIFLFLFFDNIFFYL